MCSKARNPSVARTTSCRRSWATPPREIVGESLAAFKSTPRKIGRKPLCVKYFRLLPAQRTGQQWAHNLIRKPSGKDSLRLRRKVAAWDDEFLASLIAA